MSESDTLALLAQRIPAAALSKEVEKMTMLIPSHHLKEGAVYTAGTCCANNFSSLLYSSQPPTILILGFSARECI